MEQPSQAIENRILERLNAGKNVRSLFIYAVELLTDIVGDLVLQAFRKDDYAVKYAVGPLLSGNGPLGALSIRLKLIYGLGIISRHEYEDCELVMALYEELKHDRADYSFSDDEIVGPIGELHCISALPPAPPANFNDPALTHMQHQRYQQVIRSTLVLALTTLLAGIGVKKAFGH
ncbi:MltR family transcriptional regulator [Salmonella enterica subsp. enterica serovar Choleraesuis]|nr:MltR family transcriptional regulator [Salmonella enterica subsp. enterica serovar Choleraesuis]